MLRSNSSQLSIIYGNGRLLGLFQFTECTEISLKLIVVISSHNLGKLLSCWVWGFFCFLFCSSLLPLTMAPHLWQVFSYTEFVCACARSLFKPFFFSLHLESLMSYASLCITYSILISCLFVFTFRKGKNVSMFSFFALWLMCSQERMWPNSNQGTWRKDRKNSTKG